MKKAFYSLFILVLLLAACGGGGEEEKGKEETKEKDGAQPTETTLYDAIKEDGTLTVGTEGTYAPFTFHNDEDVLTGYDVEVIKEVAKRMDLEVEFKETQWDSMFAGLNAERFHLIANQVGINDERKENYDFSEPYTYSTAVLVIPKDSEGITSFEDLSGKKSAQSLTSNYGKIAEENGAELVGVEGLAQAIELMKQGRAEATVNDKLAVLDYIKQKGEDDIQIVAETDDVTEMAFIFNKDNKELVDAVNEQLKAMKEDGTLKKISEEWFGEDVSSK